MTRPALDTGPGSIVRRLLRAAASSRRGPSDAGAVRIGGLEVTGLSAGSSSGAAMTKAGRLSLRGRTADGARVKIVEAHSPAHAEMIASLASGTLSDVLPPVLAVEGALVVSAWVERDGTAPEPDAATLAALLARIHAHDAAEIRRAFDPWHDHVLPRARRVAATLGATDRLEELLAPAHEAVARATAVLCHADVTPDNVVPVAGGHRIVDNELLGVGSTPALDLANLARGLQRDREVVVDAYVAAGGRPIGADDLVAARAMWLARMLGSQFVAGRLSDCRALLDAGTAARPLPFER